MFSFLLLVFALIGIKSNVVTGGAIPPIVKTTIGDNFITEEVSVHDHDGIVSTQGIADGVPYGSVYRYPFPDSPFPAFAPVRHPSLGFEYGLGLAHPFNFPRLGYGHGHRGINFQIFGYGNTLLPLGIPGLGLAGLGNPGLGVPFGLGLGY